LFYDVNDFYAYEEYLRSKHRIKVPIIPGILPFQSAEQIKRFTRLCGSRLPDAILRRMETLGDDESVRRLGVDVCTELCRRLLDHGVPGIHFYCLNRVPSCTEVLRNLGLAPML
jgi:methylenetetrahydrofolate reductase (NADPH)